MALERGMKWHVEACLNRNEAGENGEDELRVNLSFNLSWLIFIFLY
jgi:hypothetical protein